MYVHGIRKQYSQQHKHTISFTLSTSVLIYSMSFVIFSFVLPLVSTLWIILFALIFNSTGINSEILICIIFSDTCITCMCCTHVTWYIYYMLQFLMHINVPMLCRNFELHVILIKIEFFIL